jgi:hypothetical protein
VPRDLGDVLHYFFREDAGRPAAAPAAPVPPAPATPRAALPVIATPLSERDVVRAALLWNLAVEVARQGASASVVAPAQGDSSALWPEPGRGPLGAELVLTFADDLAGLARSAFEVAAHAGASGPPGSPRPPTPRRSSTGPCSSSRPSPGSCCRATRSRSSS